MILGKQKRVTTNPATRPFLVVVGSGMDDMGELIKSEVGGIRMSQGRIVVITGSPGTGKSTTASLVAKESDMDKSVHMRTDDFYHYLSKGAIPLHLPESNEQNLWLSLEPF